MKILYVEDDTEYAALVQAVLTNSDPAGEISVILATTLAEAKKVSQEQKDLDVILLDLNLPDSRGIDTVRELTNGLPMVIFTGDMNQDMMKQSAAYGVRDYHIKSTATSTGLMRSLLKAYADSQRLKRFHDAVDDINAAMKAVTERAALL